LDLSLYIFPIDCLIPIKSYTEIVFFD